MSLPVEHSMILKTQVAINPEAHLKFIDWQAKLNALITAFPGFVSLEISILETAPFNWLIVQRFDSADHLFMWRKAEDYTQLMTELKKLLTSDGLNHFHEIEITAPHLQGTITEVFVTQLSPNKEKAYREWMAKIHQIEAKFPGFQGVYVQSPRTSQDRNWITLLQFDTPEHLDGWLTSTEREQVLLESHALIESLESQRIISPYAGWFASLKAAGGEVPPVWKQTMIVLLVLFPIVMLELKFLSLLTANLNSSVATFIGNALSVTLIAWPLMPIAIHLLGWWLSPQTPHSSQSTTWGTGLLILLYLFEIGIFWNF